MLQIEAQVHIIQRTMLRYMQRLLYFSVPFPQLAATGLKYQLQTAWAFQTAT